MINFIGPSYPLGGKAASERSINLYLSSIESGTGKAKFMLKSIPGLTLFSDLLMGYRGGIVTRGRTFMVGGNKLFELDANGVKTERGTLLTASGRVSIAVGVTQLVIVDGNNGYVFTLSTNTLERITSPNFYGSRFVAFLGGYFIFIRPGTQQYYISAIDDATDLDALEFSSAESNPDRVNMVLNDHDELKLFGEQTTETAVLTGGVDFPFGRISGALMEVGCMAPDTALRLDSAIYWLGQNDTGGGQVFRSKGSQPQIISDDSIDQALQASTNLAGATAYGYQQNGNTFYCINAPGLKTTLVFETKTGKWHERAELIDGEYAPHRAVDYLYSFNKCLIGTADGKVYQFVTSAHTNAGAPLVRDRISPHNATPMMQRQTYPRFQLDCEVGRAPAGATPQVMLRYSNDGGLNWSNWLPQPLGLTGEFLHRIIWRRLGTARDRVWQVRCTDDIKFDIVAGVA